VGLGSFDNPITGANGSLVINQVQSPNFNMATKTGWQIQKNGNAYFFNITATGTITATTFEGTDFTIDSAGYFLYSAAPGVGDLFVTIASVGGTDPFTSPYVNGVAAYGASGYIQLTNGTAPSGGNIAELNMNTGDGAQVQNGRIISYASSAGTSRFLETRIAAPMFPSDTGSTQILLTSTTFDGTSADESIIFMVGSTGTVMEITGGFGTPNVNIIAGAGPFTLGEGWHAVTLASGLTGALAGGIGMRVKMMPWNMIAVDMQVSATATGTYTCGTLPSASYYPNVSRNLPLGANGTNNNARLFVPTSGDLIVIVGGTGAWTGGLSTQYPTN